VNKALALLIVIPALLAARENPFFPATGIEELPVTSNMDEKHPPLQRAALTFPDSARIVKEITVTFQNLDGSLGRQTIDLDHTIDWHLPLFVSQSYDQTAAAGRTAVKQPVETEGPVKIADFGFIRFTQRGKTMQIDTAHPMQRHFTMVGPHRIVVDFKGDENFLTKTATPKEPPFTLIRVGNHDGYYRVVVELDGQYRVQVGKTPSGISLECR